MQFIILISSSDSFSVSVLAKVTKISSLFQFLRLFEICSEKLAVFVIQCCFSHACTDADRDASMPSLDLRKGQSSIAITRIKLINHTIASKNIFLSVVNHLPNNFYLIFFHKLNFCVFLSQLINKFIASYKHPVGI